MVGHLGRYAKWRVSKLRVFNVMDRSNPHFRTINCFVIYYLMGGTCLSSSVA